MLYCLGLRCRRRVSPFPVSTADNGGDKPGSLLSAPRDGLSAYRPFLPSLPFLIPPSRFLFRVPPPPSHDFISHHAPVSGDAPRRLYAPQRGQMPVFWVLYPFMRKSREIGQNRGGENDTP